MFYILDCVSTNAICSVNFMSSSSHSSSQDCRVGVCLGAVENAYLGIADAFEVYEDAIYVAYNEVTPLEVFVEDDDEDEEDYDELDDLDEDDDFEDWIDDLYGFMHFINPPPRLHDDQSEEPASSSSDYIESFFQQTSGTSAKLPEIEPLVYDMFPRTEPAKALDERVRKIDKFLETGEKPAMTQREADAFAKYAAQFFRRDGRLYRVDSTDHVRRVLDPEDRPRALVEMHDYLGHRGISATVSFLVGERYRKSFPTTVDLSSRPSSILRSNTMSRTSESLATTHRRTASSSDRISISATSCSRLATETLRNGFLESILRCGLIASLLGGAWAVRLTSPSLECIRFSRSISLKQRTSCPRLRRCCRLRSSSRSVQSRCRSDRSS